MKLRNKKTGEIVELLGIVCLNGRTFIRFDDGKAIFKFEANYLSEINKEWEDAKPKQPLIKDENVRKAIRAWAEALDLRWFKRCGPVNAHTSRLYGQNAIGTGYTMELEPDDLYGDTIYGDSISKKGYTLAELCGEEEE